MKSLSLTSLLEDIDFLVEGKKKTASAGSRSKGGKRSRSILSRARQLVAKSKKGNAPDTRKAATTKDKKKVRKLPAKKRSEPEAGKSKKARGEKKGSESGKWGKPHNPFKRKNTLGTTSVHAEPTAPQPKGTRRSRKTVAWSCKTPDGHDSKKKGYVLQKCVGIGSKNKGKTFNMKQPLSYKKSYNYNFKRYRTRKRREETRAGKRGFYWGSK